MLESSMCELVEILNFDDLVIKCCFDDGKIIIYMICELNDMYWC